MKYNWDKIQELKEAVVLSVQPEMVSHQCSNHSRCTVHTNFHCLVLRRPHKHYTQSHALREDEGCWCDATFTAGTCNCFFHTGAEHVSIGHITQQSALPLHAT